MKSIRKLLDDHYKIMGFAFGTAIILIDLLICNVTVTYGDANGYSLMAEWFRSERLFNFHIQPPAGSTEEYLFSLRGYGWPLIIALCKIMGLGTQAGYWFFMSIFMSVGISFALPEIFEILFEKKINWYCRICPIIFTIIFWNGLIIYPLSDAPSVVTVSLGLMFLAKISFKNKYIVNVLFAFLSGLALGISYYIRSGCKPVWIIAVMILLFYKGKKEYLRKIILVLVLCFGIGLSMLPQIMINQSCSNLFSYEVPIFFNSNVAGQSYYLGFTWMRYETNISGIHPEITLISYNHVLDNILAVENIAVEDVGLLTILKLLIKYPLEFLGMYATKFANFLDPRYGRSLYVVNLNARQYGTMIANYLLWFLAFWGIVVQINTNINGEKETQGRRVGIFIKKYALYMLAFIIPALVHLAGTHVEARYFYPSYVLMYMFLVTQCPWKRMFFELKSKWITLLIICLSIFGCLNSIWNFTFESFNYAQLLLDDGFETSQINKESLLEQNSTAQNISYDIWAFDIDSDMHLSMTGYICAFEKESKDSNLTLILTKSDITYFFDVNLADNAYMDDIYKRSKFSIEKELIGLEEGNYEVGFILTNGSDESVVYTDRCVEITK